MMAYRLHDRIAVNLWVALSLAGGVVASAGCIVGAFFDPAQFFRAYHFSYMFVAGIAIGGLALLMIQHLAGGVWGLMLRRIAEAQAGTMPLVALLFVPIAFGLPYIYLWANPYVEVSGKHQKVQNWYLEADFFLWRTAGYFGLWLVLTGIMRMWSRRLDDAADVRTLWKVYKLSGPGLVILGITLHFAAIDWLMSLQTEFTSTIYGPLVFSSQLLSAYALAVVLFCGIIRGPQFENLLSSKVLNDLGSLLLTLLVLWAYMAWYQFMIVWFGNLPRGAIWYLARSRGGWDWLMGGIVACGMVVPFFLLLFRAVKQRRSLLMPTAAVILVAQWLFMYYQVMPVFDAPSVWRHWMDLVMPLALGGIWFGCFLWLLGRRPLLPLHDLNYPHAIYLRELELEELRREEAVSHG